jgi:hypothetical protein
MGMQTIYKIAKGACIVLQAKGIKNASLQVRFKKRWLVLSLKEYVLSLRGYVLRLREYVLRLRGYVLSL